MDKGVKCDITYLDATTSKVMKEILDERDVLKARVTELESTVKGMGAALRLSHPYKERAETAEARVKELEAEGRRTRIAHDALALKYDQLRGVRDESGMRIDQSGEVEKN